MNAWVRIIPPLIGIVLGGAVIPSVTDSSFVADDTILSIASGVIIGAAIGEVFPLAILENNNKASYHWVLSIGATITGLLLIESSNIIKNNSDIWDMTKMFMIDLFAASFLAGCLVDISPTSSLALSISIGFEALILANIIARQDSENENSRYLMLSILAISVTTGFGAGRLSGRVYPKTVPIFSIVCLVVLFWTSVIEIPRQTKGRNWTSFIIGLIIASCIKFADNKIINVSTKS